MRLLVQRVSEASVTVEGRICGAIEHGLLVLLGIHRDDNEQEIPWLAQKLTQLRVFSDDAGKMNRSVQDVNGGILVVSQFTLYGTCHKGRRPEFTKAAGGEHARQLYENFVTTLRELHPKVETGRFAAHMDVALVNDGPITLLLEK